jgi:iron(III) transport system substrate-binding protein
VAYVALDKIFSEPILQAFEEETEIHVEPLYDVEASKTVGLANRLIAEKSNPQCDVFWNNEVVQTLRLARKNMLALYQPPNADDLPSDARCPHDYWNGFAARARVIIYNKNLINEEDVPRSIWAWGKEDEWRGKFAVANPRFGTTSTHMAVMLALSKDGAPGPQELWDAWKANDVAILTGNATVKNDVADGKYSFGLTDTDDAFGAIEDGKPAGIVYPEEGLLIPNTICLIKDAPHPEEGKMLIDYVLRAETERILAHSRSGQIPLHPGVEKPDHVPAPSEVNSLPVKWPMVGGLAEESAKLMGTIVDQASRK